MPNVVSTLNIHTNDDMPYMIGDDMAAKFDRIFNFLYHTRNIIVLIGDPGTGKSHTGKELVKHYARKKDCTAYYAVFNEETLPSTMLAGHRLENGTRVPYAAVIGEAMIHGGIVFADELPHAMEAVQTILNTVGDQDSRTSIGDLMLEAHEDFRLVLGGNLTKHAGNVGVVPSLASRVKAYRFDYPVPKTEAQIALNIAKLALGEDLVKRVPHGVIKYLISWARKIRSPEVTNGGLPISARNVALMIEDMALAPFDENAPLPDEWNDGSGAEAIRRKIAQWVFFRDVEMDADLQHKSVTQVMHFFAGLGRQNVIDIVQESSMFNLDIAGVSPGIMNQWREVMTSSII